MEQIERVARAICLADGNDPDELHDNYDLCYWELYRKEAQAAIDAIGGGWKPIETAPKDESEILVYTQHGEQYVVSYDDCFSAPWRIRNEEGLGVNVPTHWMPLPKPPTE